MTAEAQLHISVSLDGFIARNDGVIDCLGRLRLATTGRRPDGSSLDFATEAVNG